MFYNISNKSLGWKLPSIVEESMRVTGLDKNLLSEIMFLDEYFNDFNPYQDRLHENESRVSYI